MNLDDFYGTLLTVMVPIVVASIIVLIELGRPYEERQEKLKSSNTPRFTLNS
jgi:hypothetical protein